MAYIIITKALLYFFSKYMKLNSTAILTLVLLTLMVGSGYLSSVFAYGTRKRKEATAGQARMRCGARTRGTRAWYLNDASRVGGMFMQNECKKVGKLML